MMRRAGALWAAVAATLALWAPVMAQSPTTVEPKMIAPGVISGTGNEFGGTISPDEKEIYFSRSVPRSYMYAIFVSTKRGDSWGEPEVVPFSGRGRDFDPVFSPDGRRMVFISDRPVIPGTPKRDYDVWMVEREADLRWGEPRHLDAPVNTARPADKLLDWSDNEWFASLAADGTLYVASDGYEPGRTQIFRLPFVAGRFETPVNLGPAINADGFENGEPIIAPDQSFLLFAGHERKGGYGGWDLYISGRKPDGGWSEPENLGPAVNTSARDYSPRLAPDGHTLVFTSERNVTTARESRVEWRDLVAALASPLNGNGNLYEIDLCALHLRSFRCPEPAPAAGPPARPAGPSGR